MANRYAIWDKTSNVKTPSGEIFTAAQWKTKYPVANDPDAHIVCANGYFNGAFFGVLEQMVIDFGNMGADFTNATTFEEQLNVIEAHLDTMNTPSEENTAEERIAAALELQNLMALETVNTDDPDEDEEE